MPQDNTKDKTVEKQTQQPPPADNAADKKQDKPLSPEQMEGVTAFLGRHLHGKSFTPPKTDDGADDAAGDKQTQDKVAADKTADKKPDKPAADAADKKPVGRPVTKLKVPGSKATAKQAAAAPPAPSAADIAKAAGEGVAKVLADREVEQQKRARESEVAALSATDQRKVEILSRMEALQPERYKGISKRYEDSVRARDKYIEQWESKHPGEKFDEDSDEHSEFFDRHNVDWSDEDYTDALADIRAEARVAKATQATQEQVRELQRKITVQESQAQIASTQNTAASQFWGRFGDDYSGLIKPTGEIDSQKAQALMKSDPIGMPIRVSAAKALDEETAEIYKLYNGLTDLNVDKNPIHKSVSDFALEMERELMAKPVQDRTDDRGRDFLPSHKYARLSKADREQYWTLGADDLIALRSNRLFKLASDTIAAQEEQHRKWAEARGIKLSGAQAPAGEAKKKALGHGPPGSTAAEEADEADAAAQVADEDDKPDSPSSAGDSRGAAAKNKGGAGGSRGDQFINRFFNGI